MKPQKKKNREESKMTFEWIDIKKQKPKHKQEVLITTGQIVTAAITNYCIYDKDDKIFWDTCHSSGYEWDWDFNEKDITHWMPMPKLPSIEKGKE